MHELFGFLISSWLQIYQGMFQYFEKYFYKKIWKNLQNTL